MHLQHLTDDTLHPDTLALVHREREMTTAILHHLHEIDQRKLYSDFHCSSLFAYCTKILGYSESSAQRRIEAARMIAVIPEIEEKIEAGSLNLTLIGQVSQYFRQNDVQMVEDKKAILAQVEDMSKKKCEQKLFELSKKELPPPKAKPQRISSDKVKMTIVLSDEVHADIEKLRSLLGKELSMNDSLNSWQQRQLKKWRKKSSNRPVIRNHLRRRRWRSLLRSLLREPHQRM